MQYAVKSSTYAVQEKKKTMVIVFPSDQGEARGIVHGLDIIPEAVSVYFGERNL
jgi:hypothetical protein